MAEDLFDGFDHTQYRDAVAQRWGKDGGVKGAKFVRDALHAYLDGTRPSA